MLQLRIDLSPDLKRLRDEGYEIEVCGGYLRVHHVPYVNARKEVCYGVLVTELSQSSGKTLQPNTHVLYFQGEQPCSKDGIPIRAIQNANQRQVLAEGIVVDLTFSNKPKNGYVDYYEKITTYVKILSSPANALDATATAKTFQAPKTQEVGTVFCYVDTNSSRSNIQVLNEKFKNQRIAIVGMGGTGAYILDHVSKTPVAEIHMFDGDVMLQHNLFRSPGASSANGLDGTLKKVDYYHAIYSKMHNGVFAHGYYIDALNRTELLKFDYVFICIDKNSIRLALIEYLVLNGVTCIDVGLGVNIGDNNLVGTVRVTLGTIQKHDHIKMRVSGSDAELENEYNTNIQISELNALNAVLAVIKWKKLSGFYHDGKEEHHTTYSINVSQLLNEDLNEDSAA